MELPPPDTGQRPASGLQSSALSRAATGGPPSASPFSDIIFPNAKTSPLDSRRAGFVFTVTVGSLDSGGARWLEGLGFRFLARGGEGLASGVAVKVRLERDAHGTLFLRPLSPRSRAALSPAGPPSVDPAPLSRYGGLASPRESALLLPFLRFFGARFDSTASERLRRLGRPQNGGDGGAALVLAAALDKGVALSDEDLEELSLAVDGKGRKTRNLLHRMNGAAGEDGKRWLMIPVSIADERGGIEGSVRILLYQSPSGGVVSVKSLAADLRSDRRRWLFRGEHPVTPDARLLVAANPGLGRDASRIKTDLLAMLEGIRLDLVVSPDPLEDRFSDCRLDGLDFIDEKA